MMVATTKNTGKKAPKTSQKSRNSSGLGLDDIGDLSALLEHPVATESTSGPMQLDMAFIDEDVNQPRKENNPGFSPESLAELAETIRLRGVKTPISVRENPEHLGRFIINHGARRFRANKIAEKTHIPGFIDNDYQEDDQVIENIQRNELTAREVADFIGRELAKGRKKGDIAKSLGKSSSFITQHITLLELPDLIADAFNVGRVRDVTVVNELVTAYKKEPTAVETWIADEEQEITRGSVKLLREFLDSKSQNIEEEGRGAFEDDADNQDDGNDDDGAGDKKEPKQEKEPDPNKLKKAIIQVRHDDRPARLMLTRRPPADGVAWLKYDDDGYEVEANLADVQLVALVEG